MITIQFIRHAVTDIKGRGYLATDQDIPLNDVGIKSCIENKFDRESFDKVYASPTKRTIQTAELLYPYVPVEVSELISQKKWGVVTNHFKNEFDEKTISAIRNYLITPKDAESLDDVLKRLNTFFDMIKKNNKDNIKILVVTHNGILRIIKKFFLNTDSYEETNNLNGFIMKINKN